MKTHIQMLWRNTEVMERLQGDGWEVETSQQDSLCAQHHAVENEEQARQRLYKLGLLTSASIRIDFSKAVRKFHRVLPTPVLVERQLAEDDTIQQVS